MKRIFITLMLLVGITAIAQRSEGKGKRGALANYTPEQIATLHTKKMTLALDLSIPQQEEIKALALENAITRKAKMEERKAKRKDGEANKPSAEERFEMQNAKLDYQIAQKAKMKNILTKEQYTKWEKMKSHRGHRKGKFGKKRGVKKEADKKE